MSKPITIRVTDATIIAGRHAPVGSVHTVPEAEAMLILGAGRAERHLPAAQQRGTVQPAAPAVEAAQAAPVVERASAAPKAEKKTRSPKAE